MMSELVDRKFKRADRKFKQLPRSSRRNPLPVECINRSLLMRHEHLTCALVELMQIGRTPSGSLHAEILLEYAGQRYTLSTQPHKGAPHNPST